tara:strand:+ start:2981 stop:4357 length:1377 start_codon:yes stop_codon:yes gene_type:complete
MAGSLVRKYGSPKSRVADTLETAVDSLTNYFVAENQYNRQRADFKEDRDYQRRTGEISTMVTQWGPMITVDPNAYNSDEALADMHMQSQNLQDIYEVASNIGPQNEGALSQQALDAISYGGFEVTNEKGEITTLDPDESPLGMTDYDIQATEQYILGSEFITGVTNREIGAIAHEDLAEMNRLGLTKLTRAEDWDPAIHGVEIRENWKKFKKFFVEKGQYKEDSEYNKLISDNWDAYGKQVAGLASMPEYARVTNRYDGWDQEKFNLFTVETNSDTGARAFVIGGQTIPMEDLAASYMHLNNAFGMSIEELHQSWPTLGSQLKAEMESIQAGGIYNKFQSIVNDYDKMLGMESQYLREAPIDAIREGESAGEIADVMYSYQSDIEALLQPMLDNMHSGDIGNKNDLIKIVGKTTNQINANYEALYPQMFNEETDLTNEILSGYIDGLVERYIREGGQW